MGFVTGRELATKIRRVFHKQVHQKTITKYRHQMGKIN